METAPGTLNPSDEILPGIPLQFGTEFTYDPGGTPYDGTIFEATSLRNLPAMAKQTWSTTSRARIGTGDPRNPTDSRLVESPDLD
ncbi:MAG: hypothetical protein AAB834_06520 [Patescibacteria group bacterium]